MRTQILAAVLSVAGWAASAQELALPHAKPVRKLMDLPKEGAALYALPDSTSAPARIVGGKIWVEWTNAHWMEVRLPAKEPSSGKGYFIPAWRVNKQVTAGLLPLDSITHKFTLSGVVEVPGATQAALYARASEWIVGAYNSSKRVTEVNDPATARIIGKGMFRIVGHGALVYSHGQVQHTVSIFCKDGRYKYIITDLEHQHVVGGTYQYPAYSLGPLEQADPTSCNASTWQTIRQQAADDSRGLAQSLQVAMSKKAASDF